MNYAKGLDLFSLQGIKLRASMIFGLIIFIALMAFEVFNYSSTEFALHDLLGELRFAGIRWATILAVAFCGIDFAGIARLFTPKGQDEARETWYLFGAWLLAATMNAMLTWWGVSIAIVNHDLQSTAIVQADTLSRTIPVFVAIMVWLIRILIIGTIAVAVDHVIGYEHAPAASRRPAATPSARPGTVPSPTGAGSLQPRPSFSAAERSQSRAERAQSQYLRSQERPEPTYSNMSFEGRSSNRNGGPRRT